MESKVIFREKRGKVWGEVIEKDSGENVWREMVVYRSYKDRDGKWQKCGFGDRDLSDAQELWDICKSHLVDNGGKVDISAARTGQVTLDVDDSDIPF